MMGGTLEEKKETPLTEEVRNLLKKGSKDM